MIIKSRERDLGGFFVRRVLPIAERRMVGPFIFFDHMGPATFEAGKGINVRPHPHINLATVTYLFEGQIHHRDSLGSDIVIKPGAINWMIAGTGIVHSERTVEEDRYKDHRLHGIQLWVAVPEEFEEQSPQFFHHPKESLPEILVNEVSVKVLLGRAFEVQSPVKVLSEMHYVHINLKKNQKIRVPHENRENAFYVVEGEVSFANENSDFSGKVSGFQMSVMPDGCDFLLHALEDSTVMLLGGKSLGHRNIFWNFVSSSQERIEEAKKEWSARGPHQNNKRFFPIPNDQNEYVPLG